MRGRQANRKTEMPREMERLDDSGAKKQPVREIDAKEDVRKRGKEGENEGVKGEGERGRVIAKERVTGR